MNKIGTRSKRNLIGVSTSLALVIGLALARANVDFTIISGLRTAEEQNAKYKTGASKLDGYSKISHHQSGNAIDFIPYPFDGNWSNTRQFEAVWKELELCANHLGFRPGSIISWDKGHFQINAGL